MFICVDDDSVEGVQGFVQYFFGGGGEEIFGHCHSVMHEYETIQIFWGGGGKLRLEGDNSRAPLCMKPW